MRTGRSRARRGLLALAAAALLAACGGEPEYVDVRVPAGATLAQVTDSLVERDVLGSGFLFETWAKIRGHDRRIRSGTYRLAVGSSWGEVLGALTRGQVITTTLTIPEGFRLAQMAPRIATVTGTPADSVLAYLERPGLAEELGLPGPGLEGYLFPDTYRFAHGTRVGTVVQAMVDRYRAVWTAERTARREALGLGERELMTLASLVQAEARRAQEMPLISGVYHRRLDLGWLLQADPTVLYALGGPRARLLYAAIDSVADHPYNTYRQAGLPPGPIGAPGEAAIDAALAPQGDYLYFVARPDGSHVFTRSLADHNRAKAAAQREREALDTSG